MSESFSAQLPTSAIEFDGVTYAPARDRSRLRAQLDRVLGIMQLGHWVTLAQLADTTGDPEASVSARLRDCRKSKFGGHTIERKYAGNGLYRYRMVVPTSTL